MVGVIMRTKNRPLLLKRAVQSVLGQNFNDWQLCIVNDGGDPKPVEETLSTLAPEARKKVTCIHNSESVGMEAASNIGLRSLDCQYILIHDDDDTLHPDFLTKTVNYLENPPHGSVKGVVTGTERIIERLAAGSVQEVKRFPYNPWVQQISLRRMLVGNLFAPIAFLFEREACSKVGAFREDLPVLGDWDFNVRFLLEYEIGMLEERLALYHDRETVEDPSYASTIQAKAHLHQFYDNLLRNEWLRKDVSAGTSGIGLFANLALMHGDLAWQIKNDLKPQKCRIFKWK